MPPHPWQGVFPALTTPFTPAQELDLPALERQVDGQIAAGVHGLVVLGSLGEQSALSPAEKLEVIRVAAGTARARVPVLAGVAETTTAAACRFVGDAARQGADGFMVLPPMQYAPDRRETLQYFRTVAQAATRPLMIYNNPVAYRTDITPAMFAELAEIPAFVALKESSDNVRRVTDIINRTGDRYRIFTGVDNLAMESLLMGAAGWVAGLVCAFPTETVELHRLVTAGRLAEALTLYRWFAPLLALDTEVKFVQYIKLAEAITGRGSEQVRAPRLPLVGEERDRIEAVIRTALAHRPAI
jgi:4-hydroxy-tetrahydrodipicolinate synthase